MKQILVWEKNDDSIARRINFTQTSISGLFISTSDDMYISVGSTVARVEKWAPNATTPVVVMNGITSCFGLVIDRNNTMYCSHGPLVPRVLKIALGSNPNSHVVALGGFTTGSTAAKFNEPYGLFVDSNFGLYVADSGNHRIQYFPAGQTNGTTVAGATAPGTISLFSPNTITLDGNGYLYILDQYNNRIVASGINGFRCIAGCTQTNGSANNQLSIPGFFVFDIYGNIFVADRGNSRIQQFLLATNSCGKLNIQPHLFACRTNQRHRLPNWIIHTYAELGSIQYIRLHPPLFPYHTSCPTDRISSNYRVMPNSDYANRSTHQLFIRKTKEHSQRHFRRGDPQKPTRTHSYTTEIYA
jgi:hypothetical protein